MTAWDKISRVVLTENDVIAEPEVATIMQNAGKKAYEKFAHSLIVEQHRPMQSVKLYARKIEIISVDTVEKEVDISPFVISVLIDLKKDESKINTITIIPDFNGPSAFLVIICHIRSKTPLTQISAMPS